MWQKIVQKQIYFCMFIGLQHIITMIKKKAKHTHPWACCVQRWCQYFILAPFTQIVVSNYLLILLINLCIWGAMPHSFWSDCSNSSSVWMWGGIPLYTLQPKMSHRLNCIDITALWCLTLNTWVKFKLPGTSNVHAWTTWEIYLSTLWNLMKHCHYSKCFPFVISSLYFSSIVLSNI